MASLQKNSALPASAAVNPVLNELRAPPLSPHDLGSGGSVAPSRAGTCGAERAPDEPHRPRLPRRHRRGYLASTVEFQHF